MAANGVQQVFAPVLAAHSTMSSGADRVQKEQAHLFLERFQKSVGGLPPSSEGWADGINRKKPGRRRWPC